jgi:diaminopimelate decarboxylase
MVRDLMAGKAEMGAATSAAALGEVLTPTDRLAVSGGGDLLIENCAVPELLSTYGSPLFVVSEAALRANYRRIAAAFSSAWPAPVQILYAIKANNNLAVRAIMHSEGAGCDCFGTAEMYATFLGGADPAKVVVNGSNKTEAELAKAVDLGVIVNIDGEDEIDVLDRLAATAGKVAPVNVRLKVVPPEYAGEGSDYFGMPTQLAAYLQREKWGFSAEAATQLVRAIGSRAHLSPLGFSLHVGRISSSPRMLALWAAETARMVLQIRQATGFSPRMLDIGGGWARERDPESRSLALNPNTIEDYAKAVTSVLLPPLTEAGMEVPELWLEVGRYLVGNAVCLLGTVGAVKRDMGQAWINIDCSTNSLMRVDTAASRYHLFAATGMHRPLSECAHIVGPTCIDSLFAESHPMPNVARGDAIAILDAGMYAETTSTQFNGMPRPATVLVCDRRHELIKRRETVEDVFALHRIPERLRIGSTSAPENVLRT